MGICRCSRLYICLVVFALLFLVACGQVNQNESAAETHIDVLERICTNLLTADIYDGRQQCAIEIDTEADDTGLLENINAMLTSGMARTAVEAALAGFPVEENTADMMVWTLRNRSVEHWQEVLVITFRNDNLSRTAIENR